MMSVRYTWFSSCINSTIYTGPWTDAAEWRKAGRSWLSSDWGGGCVSGGSCRTRTGTCGTPPLLHPRSSPPRWPVLSSSYSLSSRPPALRCPPPPHYPRLVRKHPDVLFLSTNCIGAGGSWSDSHWVCWEEFNNNKIGTNFHLRWKLTAQADTRIKAIKLVYIPTFSHFPHVMLPCVSRKLNIFRIVYNEIEF